MLSTKLSPAQERLWFFSRLSPQSAAYNLTGAVKLEGALDRDILREAVAALVARHESLRTRFIEVDGVAMQQVDVVEPGWSVLDLEDVPQESSSPARSRHRACDLPCTFLAGARTAVSRHADPAWRLRTRASFRDASHHLGRMVEPDHPRRVLASLHGDPSRPCASTCTVAGPVRRLRAAGKTMRNSKHAPTRSSRSGVSGLAAN
jgi:hypothetical protein